MTSSPCQITWKSITWFKNLNGRVLAALWPDKPSLFLAKRYEKVLKVCMITVPFWNIFYTSREGVLTRTPIYTMMSSDWFPTFTYLFFKIWIETQKLKACTTQNTSKLNLIKLQIHLNNNKQQFLSHIKHRVSILCVLKWCEVEEYEGGRGRETGNIKYLYQPAKLPNRQFNEKLTSVLTSKPATSRTGYLSTLNIPTRRIITNRQENGKIT
jgi:hypothetical protein